MSARVGCAAAIVGRRAAVSTLRVRTERCLTQLAAPAGFADQRKPNNGRGGHGSPTRVQHKALAVRGKGMSTDSTTELPTRDVLTVEQVAARFQLSTKTVYRALERRELRAAKFGSAWRIREADADAWFEGSVPCSRSPRPETRRRARHASRPGALRALEAT